jgi:hypothetical protein
LAHAVNELAFEVLQLIDGLFDALGRNLTRWQPAQHHQLGLATIANQADSGHPSPVVVALIAGLQSRQHAGR